MDPNTKLLMDEMKKLGDRFSAVESRVDSLESSLDDRFKVVEASSSEFASWRPGVDAAVEDLKLQIGAINKQLDRVVLDRGSHEPGILSSPEAAAASPPAGNPAVGPDGHRHDLRNREQGYGSVTTFTHLPVKGTSSDPLPPPGFGPDSCLPSFYRFQSSAGPAMFPASGRLPKLNFPIFTGENPKLWQSRTENYFDMYGVDKSVWVRFAVMQFEDAAARWLQSIERKLMSLNWEDFCKLVHDRFGRDQHELLIR